MELTLITSVSLLLSLDSQTCRSLSDCTSGDDSCRSDWHCVDNKCRCGFGFGGFGK